MRSSASPRCCKRMPGISSGMMKSSHSVAPLIDEVVKTFDTLAAKNGNRIVVDCDPATKSIHADQMRVRQALLNLVGNANKFTERGTVTIRARRREIDNRESVEIAVTDTGIGMTPAQMEKLFQEFSQVDSSTTRKYGGTGLGLAISQRFCRMMGGNISVQSEAGRGSTFTITLPANVVGIDAAAAPETTPRMHAAAISRNAPLIVVADDDRTVRDVVARFLEREGFSVALADGGQQALRLVRELHPDAITLDVIMPDLDGWTVLAAIKGDPALADIPVVLLTIVDEKNRGYSLGAAEYLVKPVDREKLTQTLRRICGPVHGRVLLVEDDDIVRRQMRVQLQAGGWDISEAANGRIALACLEEACPDAIILDLIMPEMDGFEVLEEIRRRTEWRDIPVIVLTSKDLTAEDRIRLNGGVERIIQKTERDETLREVRGVLTKFLKRGRSEKTVGA